MAFRSLGLTFDFDAYENPYSRQGNLPCQRIRLYRALDLGTEVSVHPMTVYSSGAGSLILFSKGYDSFRLWQDLQNRENRIQESEFRMPSDERPQAWSSRSRIFQSNRLVV